jgi:hypothetical protein
MNAEAGQKSLCYGCVAHVPPLVAYPPYVKTIRLGEAQAPGQLNLRDLAPRWVPYQHLIGGSAGTFALRAWLLANQPDAALVGICQYHKFITHAHIGPATATPQVMQAIARADIAPGILAPATLAAGMRPAGDNDFLLARPGQFLLNGVSCDYLTQYKDAHHVQDFLRFTAMAVELGVIDRSEVIPFFQEKIFIGGGVELGVFPAEFWVSTVGALEGVAWACVHRYHDTRRAGPQSRLWGYCLERLGSYLLLRYLRARHGPVAWIDAYCGFLNRVNADADAPAAATARVDEAA